LEIGCFFPCLWLETAFFNEPTPKGLFCCIFLIDWFFIGRREELKIVHESSCVISKEFIGDSDEKAG